MELKKINMGNGRNKLGIDNARICFKNFSGENDPFGQGLGFSVIIPDEQTRDMLVNDVNDLGAGWNVKLRAPREEGDTPFMHLPVKVRISETRPQIFVRTGNKTIQMRPQDIGRLDRMNIASVDLDISPNDGDFHGRPFRSAYLDAIWVYTATGRLEQRFAEEEYPEE